MIGYNGAYLKNAWDGIDSDGRVFDENGERYLAKKKNDNLWCERLFTEYPMRHELAWS